MLWSLCFLFSWASHTLACFPAPLRQFYQQNPCPQETKMDLRQRVEDEYRRWKCKLPSSLHYRLCIWKINLDFVVVCYSSNSSFGLLHQLDFGREWGDERMTPPHSCLLLHGCYSVTNLHDTLCYTARYLVCTVHWWLSCLTALWEVVSLTPAGPTLRVLK